MIFSWGGGFIFKWGGGSTPDVGQVQKYRGNQETLKLLHLTNPESAKLLHKELSTLLTRSFSKESLMMFTEIVCKKRCILYFHTLTRGVTNILLKQ